MKKCVQHTQYTVFSMLMAGDLLGAFCVADQRHAQVGADERQRAHARI